MNFGKKGVAHWTCHRRVVKPQKNCLPNIYRSILNGAKKCVAATYVVLTNKKSLNTSPCMARLFLTSVHHGTLLRKHSSRSSD